MELVARDVDDSEFWFFNRKRGENVTEYLDHGYLWLNSVGDRGDSLRVGASLVEKAAKVVKLIILANNLNMGGNLVFVKDIYDAPEFTILNDAVVKLFAGNPVGVRLNGVKVVPTSDTELISSSVTQEEDGIMVAARLSCSASQMRKFFERHKLLRLSQLDIRGTGLSARRILDTGIPELLTSRTTGIL